MDGELWLVGVMAAILHFQVAAGVGVKIVAEALNSARLKACRVQDNRECD